MLVRKWTLFRPSVRCQAVIEHALPLIRDTYGFTQTVSGNGLLHVIEAEPLDRLGIGNWRLRNDWIESWRVSSLRLIVITVIPRHLDRPLANRRA